MATRSQSVSISSAKWLTRMMVVPRAPISRMTRQTSRRARGIEALRQFVEEDDVGIIQESKDDEQTLALTAREVSETRLGLVGEAPGFEVTNDVSPASPVEQRDGFPHSQTVREKRLLELAPDGAPQPGVVGAGVDAEHAYRPAVRPSEPLDALDRGGLSGTVRSEQAEDLATLDREGDIVDHGASGVGLADRVDRDRGARRR